MLNDLTMLRNNFSSLQEVLLEEKIITLSEGAYCKGVAEFVRFVGEKKVELPYSRFFSQHS